MEQLPGISGNMRKGIPLLQTPSPQFLRGQEDWPFRGKLDNNEELIRFANALEEVCIETVQSGKMTKDLAVCIHGNKVSAGKDYIYTEEFLEAIKDNLAKKLEAIS